MIQIVIADDEKTIREGLSHLIDSFHFSTKIIGMAEDGKEALQLVRKYNPEILIIDINMPHLNGLEAIELLRKENPEMKVIIISGYDNFNYAQKAVELGVFSYLLKPLDITKFKEVLQSAIDGYEKRLLEINLMHKTQQETHLSNYDDVKTYMKSHYAQQDFSLNQMAEDFNVSSSSMAKIIKQRTSLNFTDYLNQLRIDAAVTLLKETTLSINEISELVGYTFQHYFSRIFHKYKNMSPSDYRKENEKR